MGLGITADGVTALKTRTEGWIAGLQLAALALQNEANKAGFIETFAGDDRYVVDYLVSEVLDRQPPVIKTFLLTTSVLERPTAPLCDALTGEQNSRALLARIEHANLFLVPLDHKREVYRYHHLFGEMLRCRLLEYLGEEGVAELHQVAGDWYHQHDLVDDAIHHLLEAKAFVGAASLVESIGLNLLAQGQLSKLSAWLKALPEKVVRKYPLLGVQHAWALSLTGQLEAMEARLGDAERALPTSDANLVERTQGIIATIRAGTARKQHKSTEAIQQ